MLRIFSDAAIQIQAIYFMEMLKWICKKSIYKDIHESNVWNSEKLET